MEKSGKDVPGSVHPGKRYVSPKIQRFGKVRELTTSGSKAGKEGKGNSTDKIMS